MKTKQLSLALLAALALVACGKQEGKPAAGAADATPGEQPEEAGAPATAAAAKPALPQPDASRPLSAYPELKSGNQVMFHYVAASKLPPDFAKLAEAYSQEYRRTSDSFRRNDLLQAITPQLEAQIAAAQANPYGWMEVSDADLGPYDFARKGFPVGEFSDSRHRYFYDNSAYTLGWANYAQLAFVPVPEEALARQIEAMRGNYGNKPRLKVFFFAQSADLNNQRVEALVTRVQVTDKAKRVLVEYGPDGSVPAQAAKKEEECYDAAACAAALFGGAP
ncbi:hypothetical protein [Pseudoxanthomonas suwonensis]|jgi:hypothetical protein|uniref:hypothetical protein n=1 Tax=Pseudoxanthomonas suwonensis TaxID=314722 RepID=UPI0004650E45|nr:hypothetical protein [Pseudoxanthomonas suwonensis]